MARPKKPRVLDGVVLEENLFTDTRKRPGYFRYLQPSGKLKTFSVLPLTGADAAREANRMAAEANQERDSAPVLSKIPRESIAYQIPLYINWREKTESKLHGKASWENRKRALRGFGRDFQSLPLARIHWNALKDWWEELTFHQQKARHAEFRRLFNWLMSEGLCRSLPHNPFTSNDALARLYPMGEKERAVVRIRSKEEFWILYNAASKYPALQIAMGISLVTIMREGDICALQFSEHLEGDLLKKVISKSEGQRGTVGAARLQWSNTRHVLLKRLLARAREEAIKNYGCPYVISHTPRVKKTGTTKTHACQVTANRLVNMFAEVRDSTNLYKSLPEGRRPPGFHQIKSLAIKLAKDAGFSMSEIQANSAHTRASTTEGYMEDHQLPYDDAQVIFTEEMIGGTF
ncbi:MAG: hypothetical protein AAGI11_15020 [Pseudomonadota bacterium]